MKQLIQRIGRYLKGAPGKFDKAVGKAASDLGRSALEQLGLHSHSGGENQAVSPNPNVTERLAIASLFGVIWTAMFLANAPPGTVDPSTASLLPLLVAVAAFFMLALLTMILVSSGVMTLTHYRSANQKRFNFEIAWFYAVTCLMYVGFSAVPIPEHTFWVAYRAGLILAVLPGAASAWHKSGYASIATYAVPALAASLAWLFIFLALYRMATIMGNATHIASSHYLVVLVFLAVWMNGAISCGLKAVAGALLGIILLAFAIFSGSNGFFSLPYSLLGLTNYQINIVLPHNISRAIPKNCLFNIKSNDAVPGAYTILVKSALNDYYIVSCSGDDWIGVPKQAGGVLTFSASAPPLTSARPSANRRIKRLMRDPYWKFIWNKIHQQLVRAYEKRH